MRQFRGLTLQKFIRKKSEKNDLTERIELKKKEIEELLLHRIAYKNLVDRNKKRQVKLMSASEGDNNASQNQRNEKKDGNKNNTNTDGRQIERQQTNADFDKEESPRSAAARCHCAAASATTAVHCTV